MRATFGKWSIGRFVPGIFALTILAACQPSGGSGPSGTTSTSATSVNPTPPTVSPSASSGGPARSVQPGRYLRSMPQPERPPPAGAWVVLTTSASASRTVGSRRDSHSCSRRCRRVVRRCGSYTLTADATNTITVRPASYGELIALNDSKGLTIAIAASGSGPNPNIEFAALKTVTGFSRASGSSNLLLSLNTNSLVQSPSYSIEFLDSAQKSLQTLTGLTPVDSALTVDLSALQPSVAAAYNGNGIYVVLTNSRAWPCRAPTTRMRVTSVLSMISITPPSCKERRRCTAGTY